MFEDLLVTGLILGIGTGIEKVDESIRNHREKRFISFRKNARKKQKMPHCLYGKYEMVDGKYCYVFTDVDGVDKYYSNKVDWRTHFFLFSTTDKKKVGVVKIRVNRLKFWTPHYKEVKIFGISSGKILKETIEIDKKQYLIVGGGKQTTITEKDGTIIAKITNNMDLYMVEYIDIKYELLSLLFCMSEHVFYDVPPSE